MTDCSDLAPVRVTALGAQGFPMQRDPPERSFVTFEKSKAAWFVLGLFACVSVSSELTQKRLVVVLIKGSSLPRCLQDWSLSKVQVETEMW